MSRTTRIVAGVLASLALSAGLLGATSPDAHAGRFKSSVSTSSIHVNPWWQ